MRMKTILNWLYENWMKGTPFLALYTFILIWLYVKDANYPLFLIWLQCSAYWLHEFEEYVCPADSSTSSIEVRLALPVATNR